MTCPIKIPDALRICEVCMYGKEGKCDYPFYSGMSDKEIKEMTKRLDVVGGKG